MLIVAALAAAAAAPFLKRIAPPVCPRPTCRSTACACSRVGAPEGATHLPRVGRPFATLAIPTPRTARAVATAAALADSRLEGRNVIRRDVGPLFLMLAGPGSILRAARSGTLRRLHGGPPQAGCLSEASYAPAGGYRTRCDRGRPVSAPVL
jgi:hypothetical protein